jgi:metal-responsive CopG/Arc/MetJ family transcriptional regulator
MRTLVDLPDSDLRELTELSRRNRRSRASLIREAVATFLASHRRGSEGDAFGLWGTKRLEGLAYQKRIRSEW